MSQEQRDGAPAKPEDARTQGAETAGPEETKAQDETKKGLDYVFKIAPADPKNAFDFEDVADK